MCDNENNMVRKQAHRNPQTMPDDLGWPFVRYTGSTVIAQTLILRKARLTQIRD